MPPKFNIPVFGLLLGLTALWTNSIPASASPSKPTSGICGKDSLLQSTFIQQLGNLCLATKKSEKANPNSDNSDSDSNNLEQGTDSSDKSTPGQKTKESDVLSPPADSHDLNLNFSFQFNLGGDSGEPFGMGLTSPESIKNTPKKIKGAKSKKLVVPNLNRDLSLPLKGTNPIYSKPYPQIKSVVDRSKTIQTNTRQPGRILKIPSAAPMTKQRPAISGANHPIRHRAK